MIAPISFSECAPIRIETISKFLVGIMYPQASHTGSIIPAATAQISHLLLVSAISTLILAGTESLISQAAASPLTASQTVNQPTEVITPLTTEFSLKAEPDLDADRADAAIAHPGIPDHAALNAFAVAAEYQTMPVQPIAFQIEENIAAKPTSLASEAIANQTAPHPAIDGLSNDTHHLSVNNRAGAEASAPPQQVAEVQSVPPRGESNRHSESSQLGVPIVRAQAAYILQDGNSSERLRATGIYAATPNLLFGATLDLTEGNGFNDSENATFDLNELYVTVSPQSLPNLHFTAGMVDLTSYFDRNSFAKDSVTHFFNSVFQTNPALAATGIGSRPAALVNWDLTDDLNVKAAGFSSSRDFGNLAIDGFAGEVGARFGNFVVRGTYTTDRDAGQNDGFREIFQFNRGNDRFGLRSGDREEAFGVNAELFIPELKLGLFGRYGHYQNLALDRGGETYSFGLNLLDLLMADDRLGLAYGMQLSNSNLRQRGDRIPDVLEAFYDFRLLPNLRAGVMVQERNGFSDSVLGLRIRADFDVK